MSRRKTRLENALSSGFFSFLRPFGAISGIAPNPRPARVSGVHRAEAQRQRERDGHETAAVCAASRPGSPKTATRIRMTGSGNPNGKTAMRLALAASPIVCIIMF
jgi:hypothetical protein